MAAWQYTDCDVVRFLKRFYRWLCFAFALFANVPTRSCFLLLRRSAATGGADGKGHGIETVAPRLINFA